LRQTEPPTGGDGNALWESVTTSFLGVDPDGFNFNKECGSTSPERCRKVREMRDRHRSCARGDAIGSLVGERWDMWSRRTAVAVIAQSWKEGGRLAKTGIVAR